MNNSSIKILVVDDEPLNCILLKTYLEEEGYGVETAVNGNDALAILAQQQFDVILLDLIMPQPDGFEVLRQIKATPALAQIPVVVVSASEDLDSAIKSIEMGALDFLPKPFDPVFLKARINASLAAKRYSDLQTAYTQELEARNEELSAFAQTVDHDLRLPINIIAGYADLLRTQQDKLFETEREKVVDGIFHSAKKATGLIDSLMLLSLLRNDKIQMVPIKMASILDEVIKSLDPMIKSQNGVIQLPEAWPEALGSDIWVSEVWKNYLSNGLHYGGESPLLTLGADVDGAFVRFWVQDNGDGIYESIREDIFRPYIRTPASTRPGYSLGLSIVRRIVEKLGGEVGVESEEGVGSLFWFTLPINSDKGQ